MHELLGMESQGLPLSVKVGLSSHQRYPSIDSPKSGRADFLSLRRLSEMSSADTLPTRYSSMANELYSITKKRQEGVYKTEEVVPTLLEYSSLQEQGSGMKKGHRVTMSISNPLFVAEDDSDRSGRSRGKGELTDDGSNPFVASPFEDQMDPVDGGDFQPPSNVADVSPWMQKHEKKLAADDFGLEVKVPAIKTHRPQKYGEYDPQSPDSHFYNPDGDPMSPDLDFSPATVISQESAGNVIDERKHFEVEMAKRKAEQEVEQLKLQLKSKSQQLEQVQVVLLSYEEEVMSLRKQLEGENSMGSERNSLSSMDDEEDEMVNFKRQGGGLSDQEDIFEETGADKTPTGGKSRKSQSQSSFAVPLETAEALSSKIVALQEDVQGLQEELVRTKLENSQLHETNEFLKTMVNKFAEINKSNSGAQRRKGISLFGGRQNGIK